MTTTTIERPRKSEKLTRPELIALKKWVDCQPTKIDAAVSLDIARSTLDRIILSGSGKPETIANIRSVINQ